MLCYIGLTVFTFVSDLYMFSFKAYITYYVGFGFLLISEAIKNQKEIRALGPYICRAIISLVCAFAQLCYILFTAY